MQKEKDKEIQIIQVPELWYATVFDPQVYFFKQAFALPEENAGAVTRINIGAGYGSWVLQLDTMLPLIRGNTLVLVDFSSAALLETIKLQGEKDLISEGPSSFGRGWYPISKKSVTQLNQILDHYTEELKCKKANKLALSL